MAAVINVPADQPTIQAAITAALPGDTILLDNAFSPFAEGLITIPVAKNNLTIDGQEFNGQFDLIKLGIEY